MKRDFDDDVRRKSIVEAIGKIIDGQQEVILAAVGGAVQQHISARSPRECLELVLLSADGAVARRLPMEASTNYAKALIAFVRGQQFDGYPMDSALTGPTAAIVGDIFAERVGERSGEIVEQLIPLLVSDRRFVDALADGLVSAYSSTLPKTLQSKMVSLLTHKLGTALSQTIDTTTMVTIKATIVKASAVAISSPIAMKITASLLTSMAAALKPIIVKLLASAAFKAAIVAKLRAIVVGSLLGAFIKIIGVKVGLSAGAVFMWIVLPLVLAWLTYEYFEFPDKLAKKVSEGIVEEMRGNFPESSKSIAESLVQQVMVTGAGMLAGSMINDELIQELMGQARREAEA